MGSWDLQEHLISLCRNLSETPCMFLKDRLQPICRIKYFPFGDREKVVSPDKALANSIMIFDDVSCEKQDHLKNYFCMGRHGFLVIDKDSKLGQGRFRKGYDQFLINKT